MGRITGNQPLSAGVSDFKTVVKSFCYVDKTLLIKDVIDQGEGKTSLFTRPRRFGKTLNLDMLRTFFEISDEDTSVYFREHSIWICGERYTSQQGKYPVVWLSFQNYEAGTIDDAISRLKTAIWFEFSRHEYLAKSDMLSQSKKAFFQKVLSTNFDLNDCLESLKLLISCLSQHHGKKVVVIIDEYDKMMQESYFGGYYDKMSPIARQLLSGALKDNAHLQYGFLTGILNLGKDSSFSSLNNVNSYSIFDDKYSQYFGFTRNEVQTLLAAYGVENHMSEVCDWYDGYVFGNTEIFNPLSIIKYLEANALKGYWTNVSSNNLLKILLDNMDNVVYDDLVALWQGKEIVAEVDTVAVYSEIKTGGAAALYSILLGAGYLRGVKIDDDENLMRLRIPNKELRKAYKREILLHLQTKMSTQVSNSIAEAIVKEDFVFVQNEVGKYMVESISSYDAKDENSYHALMLGLIFPLHKIYEIKSNIESGTGQYDIMLKPKDKTSMAFIFELKYTKDNGSLDALADKALSQIDNNKYDTDLRMEGFSRITKVGIAFRGKSDVVVKTK